MTQFIGIIGPESTGKTTLARQLADRTGCDWEPELARHYVERLNRAYTEQDVLHIARLQIERELLLRRQTSGKPYIFFDTELIITRVWLEHHYGHCPDFVSRHIDSHPMDRYLLCRPDIEWQPDSVRENGDIRPELFARYETLARQTGRPCAIVSGQGAQRLACALQALSAPTQAP